MAKAKLHNHAHTIARTTLYPSADAKTAPKMFSWTAPKLGVPKSVVEKVPVDVIVILTPRAHKYNRVSISAATMAKLHTLAIAGVATTPHAPADTMLRLSQTPLFASVSTSFGGMSPSIEMF